MNPENRQPASGAGGAGGQAMKLWRAVNTALRDAMEEDSRVVVFGQDVAGPGGPFGLTRGLLQEFGPERVRDAPISEAALMACATGAAVMGLKPVVEIMFFDFISLGLDQLVNQAAKYRFFTGGRSPVPMVVHTLYGGRASYGAQHSQSLEAWLCHVPGLKVAFPSTPNDAHAVLRAAIADDDPVVVVESIALLRDEGPVDVAGWAETPIGEARIVRRGDDVTVVSWGPAVAVCEEAIASLGVEADLIDLRWLQPWDVDSVVRSVQRTGRLLVVHDAPEPGGWGAEIVARVTKECFWALDTPPLRVGGHETPIPTPRSRWESVVPDVGRVGAALLWLLRA